MILACFWSFGQVTYWNFFPALALQCPLCFETFVEGVYQNKQHNGEGQAKHDDCGLNGCEGAFTANEQDGHGNASLNH